MHAIDAGVSSSSATRLFLGRLRRLRRPGDIVSGAAGSHTAFTQALGDLRQILVLRYGSGRLLG